MKSVRLFPVAIMVVLLLAWSFRWDYVGTKTCIDYFFGEQYLSEGIVRYKVDRWTSLTGGGGYKWQDIFSEAGAGTMPAYDSKKQLDLWNCAIRACNIGIALWWFLVGVDALWFVVLVCKRPRATSSDVSPSRE